MRIGVPISDNTIHAPETYNLSESSRCPDVYSYTLKTFNVGTLSDDFKSITFDSAYYGWTYTFYY